ncbi:MAG: shikimate 5-dehydrogenase [Chitinophagales bacterium]|nr:MAG: shikimate 5-dehydrogenase [Chitinophagales bacterium]
MRRFGLIGYPLRHSFSRQYFTEKFQREAIRDAVYENFPLPTVGQLPELIAQHTDLRGLNVTIPHKQAIIPLLNETEAEATTIGAVNTIKISSGKMVGFNTDHIGFMRSLLPLLQPHHKKALILGTGGASLAIRHVLQKLGIAYALVSRQPVSKKGDVYAYSELTREIIQQHLLIVNTTPAGMVPHTGKAPAIPYAHLTTRHLLYDLVYNPSETLFMQMGKKRGAAVCNGWNMLTIQAEEAWKIWSSF